MNIVCGNCFTTNRIPNNKDYTKGKCGKCQQGVYSPVPITLTNNTFHPFIDRNDLPVIVDFWASWCAPCQNMAPIYNKVALSSPSLLFAKVNTEHLQKVSADAGIRSLPTLVLFYKGKEVDRVSGGLNEMQMKQWLVQSLQKVST